MGHERRLRGRAASMATAGAVGVAGMLLAVLLTGCGGTDVSATTPAAPPSPSATDGFSAGGLQDPAVATSTVSIGNPVQISIPGIGVTAGLEDLKIGAGGRLDAPAGYDRAGWYADGPAPGQIGPAIIAGHVDSATGPAIFHDLSRLDVGDEVIVTSETGESLTFRVTGRVQSAKATFPTAAVYSNVPRPELRLITCAGYFDRSTGHYVDNLIVFASLAD